jgi:maltose/maltodextrin transport system substrate-binding protein
MRNAVHRSLERHSPFCQIVRKVPNVVVNFEIIAGKDFPRFFVYRAFVERALRKKSTYPTKRLCLWLWVLFLIPMRLFAWSDGELLIWMDTDRGHALKPIAQKFEKHFGIKATIEAPEKITDSFPLAAQAAKGPDIVIWAHDKVGEWAEGGLIAPVEFSDELTHKYFPKALQAVLHENRSWGYPIALETVTLIYNRKLVDGLPPTELSQLEPVNQKIKAKHPGVTSVLWDYKSAYYSWGILDSAGGYVFGKKGTDYDLTDVGVATPESVEGLSRIIALVQAGILPKSVSYSAVEEMMGQNKLAMMISGPWSWANLRQRGINFGVAPMPGVNGKPGRPFVGVMVAYLNRSSPNQDLAKEFLEQSMLTGEGLSAMNYGKPIGVPALISLYERMAKNSVLLRELKASVDYGEVMPNIPQMARFFTSVGAALQIATEGRASAEAALQEAEANMRRP